MSTVSRTDFDVYLGFWTDWGQGKVNGATLTLTRRDGGFLMSFIAIFIALSGKSFWRICCFIIHRCLSTISPQDGLHHQRQAILRNADTPEGGAWKFAETLIAWRKHARRPTLRLLPIALLAFITFIALLVGGIFSSRMATDGGSEVLLTGEKCGPLTLYNTTSTEDYLSWIMPHTARRATAYSNYALQCYTEATNSDDCHLYVKPSISTTITRNASCPFSEEMCKSSNGNIIVDSGYMNSQYDMGINTPANERFDLRFVYHCAPIVSEGFKKILKRSNDSAVPEVVQYFYGNLTYGPQALNPDEYTGFTFEALNNYSRIDLPGYTTAVASIIEYNLGVVSTGGGIFDFKPIPQLNKTDADTILMFLDAQGIAFQQAVEDPWFSAHQPWVTALTSSDLEEPEKLQYLSDEPASALGCTGQAQFCNPNLPRDQGCEPLSSLMEFTNHQEDLWSKEQLDALSWAGNVVWQEFSDPLALIGSIGTSILAARYSLANGICGPLPNNQWQIEIEHFMHTLFASIQGTFVESANGPREKGEDKFQQRPNSDQAFKMCKSQKIRSTLYSSFRVVPLAIILITGVLLILVNLTLEPLLNSIHARRAKHLPHYHVTRSAHSRLEWRTMSFLQLQRMAHEGIGSGTWLRTTSETPITTPRQNLGMLDIRDQKRPLLTSRAEDLGDLYTFPDSSMIKIKKSQSTLKSPTTLDEKSSMKMDEKSSTKADEKSSTNTDEKSSMKTDVKE